jgi:hypothetical protein
MESGVEGGFKGMVAESGEKGEKGELEIELFMRRMRTEGRRWEWVSACIIEKRLHGYSPLASHVGGP